MKIRLKLNEVKRIVRPPPPVALPTPSPAAQEEYEVVINGKTVKKKKPLPINVNNRNILSDAFQNQKSLIDSAFLEIPILSEMRIKKKLAAGTQGVIFSLEDDRILKIYTGSYFGGIQKEDQRYERLKTKVFSSEGSKTDLLVYDHGAVSYTDSRMEKDYRSGKTIETLTQKEFGWVIMGKVLTLTDYISIKYNMDYSAMANARRAYDGLFYALHFYVDTYLKKPNPNSALAKYSYYIDPKTIDDIKNHIKYQQEVLGSTSYSAAKMLISEEFVDRFLDAALTEYIQSGNDHKMFNDLHPGNIGVRNEIDPTPVIFDV
jgi:hypothetical protein